MCVGERISLPWFSKELKNNLSKNNCLRGVILILLVRESIFVGWGSPFPIVLVPRYKLSLCYTTTKPDLLGFPGIDIFACGLHDHVITRFTSLMNVILTNGYGDRARKAIQMVSMFSACSQARETQAMEVFVSTFIAQNSTITLTSLACLKNIKSNLSCMPNLDQLQALF